jgi:hypothetical protein
LRDPHHVVEKLEIQQADRAHAVALDEVLRFPHSEADLRRALAPSDLYSGFAVFLPTANRKDASCRLTLHLRSGERIVVADGPTFLAPDAALAALLAAVPADSAPADAIAARIEPALAALRTQHTRREPELIDIGTLPAEPAISLIVPLTEEADLVRCRMGLFATDPAMQWVEIIHVLDRAQKRAGAERLLRAMHTAYGVPTRLVIVDEPVESGAALNAAAKSAQAPLLAILGTGVLPEQAGWLDTLAKFMDAHPRCGMAGPRLMRDDGSLASAGLEFGPDIEGRWDAKPLLRGFPCDFPAATAAAPVAGLAHGCVIIRRSLFELVGGFAEDYLDRQRQSADVGARVSSHGLEVWRTATAPLFDLAIERTVSTLAAELDRRALEQRWRSLMTAEPVAAETPAPDAEPKSRTRARRRRRVA